MMYESFILHNMPRVLTQIDRDCHSTTYGSCDRNHWHLKIRDFSSAILQQSGLALAVAYTLDFPGNLYYGNDNVKEWAMATVHYWAKIQLSDGSFNEYYPWEHGFPPTAFSLYGACQVYSRLQMKSEYIEQKMAKTCRYLIKHIEKKAFNQEIASITALYSAYSILKEKWILQGMQAKLDRILELQSQEGWFPEYGGADLGYLSVAFDMLAEYYWLSNDQKVREPLKKVLDFIQYFIHPDGTVGGEYGSRNTTYFLPNGLQVLACQGDGVAERAIEVLYGDTERTNYFLDSTDDRYFSHYLLHSFLRAREKRMSQSCTATTQLPFEYNHKKVFTHAGLVSYTNDCYSAFFSLKKGGLLKVFVDGAEKFIDCGYRIDFSKGNVAVTNWIDDDYATVYNSEDNAYSVSGKMNRIKLKVQNPIYSIGLRCVAFFLGNKIIGMLKKKIILVNKHVDTVFSRSLQFSDNGIVIEDTFKDTANFSLERASNMSMRHVASGKFFMTSDLLTRTAPIQPIGNEYQQKITVSISEGSVEVEYV